MPPTLLDIAKAARTSPSTVSRVLAGGTEAKRISDKTRDRVLIAANKLGYRPNLLARSLRTRRSNTVALLVSDIANPFFGQIASLVEQTLHRRGYSLVLCNSGEDPDIEAEYLRLLPQKGIDGLVLVPTADNKERIAQLLPTDLPVVLLDRPMAGMPASVSSDQDQLTTLLCDTLAGVGVHRVAVAAGPQHVVTHRRRFEVIGQRFEVIDSHFGPAQRETGRQAYIKFFADPAESQKIDAIVCTNNFLAQGILDSLADLHSPPIIGCFDELAMAYLLPVPIAQAMQDVPMLAEACATQLLTLLAGGAAAEQIQPIVLPSRAVTNRQFKLLYAQRHSIAQS